MTAETLRRAAAKIRETAEGATPGPWIPLSTGSHGGNHWYVTNGGESVAYIRASDGEDEDRRRPTAEHIALWHPGTALLVADLLEEKALLAEVTADFGGKPEPRSLALARQILGEA